MEIGQRSQAHVLQGGVRIGKSHDGTIARSDSQVLTRFDDPDVLRPHLGIAGEAGDARRDASSALRRRQRGGAPDAEQHVAVDYDRRGDLGVDRGITIGALAERRRRSDGDDQQETERRRTQSPVAGPARALHDPARGSRSRRTPWTAAGSISH
jgi:hypothetical protein